MSFVTRFKEIWNETIPQPLPRKEKEKDSAADRFIDFTFDITGKSGTPTAVQNMISIGAAPAAVLGAVSAYVFLPAVLTLGIVNLFYRDLKTNGKSEWDEDLLSGLLLLPSTVAALARSPFIAVGYLAHAALVATEAAGFGKIARPAPKTGNNADAGITTEISSSLKPSSLTGSSAPGFNGAAAVATLVAAETPVSPARSRKLTL